MRPNRIDLVRLPTSGSDDRGLAGRRFVVVGDGRLSDAVTEILERRHATVDRVAAGDTVRSELRDALETDAACVLGLDDHHETNLHAALVVSDVNDKANRQVPVVVRAFDPALADEIERTRPDVPFRVRGAYSVAHLAAPDFVVAALVEEDEKNVVTLRLGEQYVNVCRLRVRGAEDGRWRRRRPMVGRTPAKLLDDRGCQVLARRRLPGGAWEPAGDAPLEADEEILVGGRLLDVLRLVRRPSAGGPSTPLLRHARVSDRRRELLRTKLRRTAGHARMRTTQFLVALFVLVTIAVLLAPVDSASSRVYLWVLTALGSPPPTDIAPPSPLVSALGLLAGGVALGLGISLMSAYFMHLRSEETIFRRARRLRHHVVILGLGDVGLRISQLLDKLGVPCAVVDTATDAETVRRRRQAGLVPVIPADLECGLPAARIDSAFSLIATSDNNLLNVEACLRAKRATQERIRTIARIFDDPAAEIGARAFGVDDQIAAAGVAAPAFVDAALQEESLRWIDFQGWPMAALRWPAEHPVGSGQMRRWHDQGVRLLAVWRHGHGATEPGSEAPGIQEGQSAILVGPVGVMEEQVLDELRRRTGPSALSAAA